MNNKNRFIFLDKAIQASLKRNNASNADREAQEKQLESLMRISDFAKPVSFSDFSPKIQENLNNLLSVLETKTFKKLGTGKPNKKAELQTQILNESIFAAGSFLKNLTKNLTVSESAEQNKQEQGSEKKEKGKQKKYPSFSLESFDNFLGDLELIPNNELGNYAKDKESILSEKQFLLETFRSRKDFIISEVMDFITTEDIQKSVANKNFKNWFEKNNTSNLVQVEPNQTASAEPNHLQATQQLATQLATVNNLPRVFYRGFNLQEKRIENIQNLGGEIYEGDYLATSPLVAGSYLSSSEQPRLLAGFLQISKNPLVFPSILPKNENKSFVPEQIPADWNNLFQNYNIYQGLCFLEKAGLSFLMSSKREIC